MRIESPVGKFTKFRAGLNHRAHLSCFARKTVLVKQELQVRQPDSFSLCARHLSHDLQYERALLLCRMFSTRVSVYVSMGVLYYLWEKRAKAVVLRLLALPQLLTAIPHGKGKKHEYARVRDIILFVRGRVRKIKRKMLWENGSRKMRIKSRQKSQ